ncbi:MAG: alanine--glyoxylate aminotransferase family protein [Planctomycetes bacterium]|nr:alanine--glyoxylate aminotransferase family protein [Planctomycetota bacterium]
MTHSLPTFVPPARLLLGPGPSDVAPSVLRALAAPTLGHLDPKLFEALDQIRAMLRTLFGTRNAATLAVSGTGTSGMEAVLCNLIEPGDAVLVPVHGYFGARVAEIAARCGADVVRVDGTWGRVSDVAAARVACQGRRIRVVAVVHAETSTGVREDLEAWRDLSRELGALFVADTVTSLGCIPIDADAHGLDAAWSCTQKGLSCTPGLAPVTFSERALERIRARSRKVQSFYFDLGLLLDFWGGAHAYHHTISSNLLYALHEAARLVLAEGLEQRFAQHSAASRACVAGLEALGLSLLVEEAQRLPQLLAVRIPSDVPDVSVRTRLLQDFGIEIGGGLGPFKGQLWRVGLMGHGATRRNVTTLLAALGACLRAEGFQPRGDGVAAAERVFSGAERGAASVAR